ncbi:MAG: HD domain-containing protein [Clostridiales bacterium]|nr:HD domain-containing protein [Clostridiales bacterium]
MIKLTQLQNGQYEGFAVIKRIEKKTTARGSAYLDMVLGDKHDELPAKKWEYAQGFTADMAVKVRGELENYNGKEQFKVIRMRPVTDQDGVSMEELIPSAPLPGEALWEELYQIVQGFQDADLKAIVTLSLERNKERLLYFPAALRLHHAMRGGLLYHILSIVRMGQMVSKLYPNIDEDLLLAGTILHDMAKTWELDVAETGIARSYTPEGELIGHLVKGAIDIEDLAEEVGAGRETVTLLQHMVISHHGEPEYGAAVRPMFLEAVVLSALDSLDATIYEVAHATSKVKPGGFTDRQWALDNRKLYNHGRRQTEHIANLIDGGADGTGNLD